MNDITINYELIKEDEVMYVYYIHEEKVIGYPIKTNEKNKFTLIDLAFKYLTEKANSIDEEYYSMLNFNAKLLSYSIRNDSIYLDVNEAFFDIKEDTAINVLSQVLYTYKELGYQKVYVLKNGLIINQIEEVILTNGMEELAVNLDMSNTTKDTKIIKITYQYKDKSKGFINHIVNKSEDEVSFKLNKLVNFINKEYDCNVKLLSYKRVNLDIIVYLSSNDKDIEIIKKMLVQNLKISQENIIIS